MHGGEVEAVLVRLADIADSLTLPVWQRGSMQVTTKSDGSPVTETDVAVETAVRAELHEVFPDDGFCGEEVGETSGASGHSWIVDGIDGTRAFTSGEPAWSTLIALVIGEQPVAGMVTSPAQARRWYCSPGEAGVLAAAGAAPQKLTVSTQTTLAGARVIAWPFNGPAKPVFRDQANRLGDIVSRDMALRPSADSAVPNGAMLVAEGRVDGFVMFGGQPWDHAANAAVLTAAGGRFSCLDGTDSLWAGSGVYTNSHIHDELVDRLR